MLGLDEVTTLAVAGFAVADALLWGGAFEVGQAKLDSLTLPPTTAATAGLLCALTACRAQAVLAGRPGDAAAPMTTVAEVAGRFGASGDTDPLGFVHSPVDAGIERMSLALKAGEPDQTVSVAHEVHADRHPSCRGLAGEDMHPGQRGRCTYRGTGLA